MLKSILLSLQAVKYSFTGDNAGLKYHADVNFLISHETRVSSACISCDRCPHDLGRGCGNPIGVEERSLQLQDADCAIAAKSGPASVSRGPAGVSTSTTAAI
jgi:hypothetical protein